VLGSRDKDGSPAASSEAKMMEEQAPSVALTVEHEKAEDEDPSLILDTHSG